MPTFRNTDKPVVIVQANPMRSLLIVGNISDTTAYVAINGKDIDTFPDRAWPIKLDGNVTFCSDPSGYKGPVYAMVSAASDIRILEA